MFSIKVYIINQHLDFSISIFDEAFEFELHDSSVYGPDHENNVTSQKSPKYNFRDSKKKDKHIQ